MQSVHGQAPTLPLAILLALVRALVRALNTQQTR